MAEKNKGGRPWERSMEDMEKMADELEAFADRDDSLTMLDWYATQRIDYKQAHDFCARCPRFRQAFIYAKAKIGARREAGAMTNKYNAGFTARGTWQYDPEVRDYNKEMAKIGADAAKTQGELLLEALRETSRLEDRKSAEES